MTTQRHPYNQWAPDACALDVVGGKWTLLIVRDLLVGPTRFVELQRRMPGISTEQLRTRLNMMVEEGLVTRTRYREAPPRVDYVLTAKGRALVPVLEALAEWGFSHAWGAPRRGEAVDLTALFRLLPATLDELPAGEFVLLEVTDGEVPAYQVSQQGVDIVVEAVGPGQVDYFDTTVLRGTRAEWIDAILTGTLEPPIVTGSREVASRVMRALSGWATVQAIEEAAA